MARMLTVALAGVATLPAGAHGATAPPQCSLSAGAYTGSNGPPETKPVARFRVTPSSPAPGAPATFDASGSSDADGDTIVAYAWNFGDGSPFVFTGSPKTAHTFFAGGTYTVTLEVADCRDSRSRSSASVNVGSTPSTAGATRCTSRRKVSVALPHGRGVTILGATISGGGRATRHIGARSLRGRRLTLSLFGYQRKTVTVAIRVRSHGRTRTIRHKLHPCG